MEDLEKIILEESLSSKNHLAEVYGDPKYLGWHLFEAHNEPFTDYLCLYRIPETIKIYKGVLKSFTPEERKAGLYRFPIGREQKMKIDDLVLKLQDPSSFENLSKEQVSEIIDNTKKTITFNCNAIPYLHIRKSSLREDNINIKNEINKFVSDKPNYIDILYKTTNEKITTEEAETESDGVIFNEFKKIFKES